MKFAQCRPDAQAGSPSAVVDFRDLWYFPQTIEALRRAALLQEPDIAQLRAWAVAFLNSGLQSGQLNRALGKTNNVSTWAQSLVISLGFFSGKSAIAIKQLHGASLRLGRQLGPLSMQIHEVTRNRPLHYSLFNLAAWASIVCWARAIDMRLLDFTGVAGESLQTAMRFCSTSRTLFGDYHTAPGDFDFRIECLSSFYLGTAHVPAQSKVCENANFGLPPLWPLLIPRTTVF